MSAALTLRTAARHDCCVCARGAQQPDGAQRALAVLRKPSCPAELVYRFAPGLMVAAPGPCVDLFISTRPALEPR